MHIRHFLVSCLSFVSAAFVGLGAWTVDLIIACRERWVDLWRVAFPPDPLHLPEFADWRGSLGRAVAPFRAFIERARSHEAFSGSGFHLDTVARVF